MIVGLLAVKSSKASPEFEGVLARKLLFSLLLLSFDLQSQVILLTYNCSISKHASFTHLFCSVFVWCVGWQELRAVRNGNASA
jgi:hypothetical protein